MLGTVPNRPLNTEPIPIGAETALDWDTRLGIDFIREYTKTDDTPAVTDGQLRLFRASAIEAAEQYTGLLLAGIRNISKSANGPREPRPGHITYKLRLQYPTADGIVYLYGGTHPNDNRVFRVAPGSRKISVPIRTNYIDLSNCCDPCSTWNLNGGMMVAYRAGFASVDAVPAGIIHGMLQFMAWCVEHPGDELLTQRNRVETRAGLAGLQGTNNIAMVSGALESWVRFDNERW